MIVPTIPYNPVILILHNEAQDTYHPILLWEAPPPSGQLGDAERWKSKGHHTEGFKTLQEAIDGEGGALALCKNQHMAKVGGEVYYNVDQPLEWDGIPDNAVMVTGFDLSKLTKYEPEETQPETPEPAPSQS